MSADAAHVIVAGVCGWLESPAADAVGSDCLVVSGWAFTEGSPIVELWAEWRGSRQSLQYGLPRADVARVYPDEASASHSGFTGYLEFDNQARTAAPLDVWAMLADGRSLRLFRRRLMTSARDESPVRDALRHAVRHPGLLLSRRAWLAAFRLVAGDSPHPANPVASTATAGDALRATTRAYLTQFLAARSELAFNRPAAPTVSVVIVVWNQADLTLRCLRALTGEAAMPIEVVLVDNASMDETARLLEAIKGIHLVRNAANTGFTIAANQGARAARGEFLLFLNNDAELLPGSIEELIAAARRTGLVGAVGGKLVLPDGQLQEAGSIIWSDGSCDAYGRGGNPADPAYNFERPVDFCSGALLLTRRDIFEAHGGFDERYRPAYYEDADYCARLWTNGYSVLYQPKAVAIHCEFGSAASDGSGIELQRERRPLFVERHGRWLSSQPSRSEPLLSARSHPYNRPSLILVDDAVPEPKMGAGFPRGAALLRTLIELGYQVTMYVTGEGQSSAGFPTVEVVAGPPAGLRTFFASRQSHDLVIVSRPHNMQYVKAAVGADLSSLGVPCIYDAEAIYALRDIGRRRAAGRAMPHADAQALIDRELGLTRGSTAVLTVSDAEQRLFASAGVDHVFVASHAVEAVPTARSYDERRTILFVGAFSPDSPNEDAALFFCRDVLPALRMMGCTAPVVIAGAGIPNHLPNAGGASVSWRTDVHDLTPLYEEARVFIAPTRYGAGIPLKVVEAAGRGVPIVSTPLMARQLGWNPGTEILAAETPVEFARAVSSLYSSRERWTELRDAALKRIAEEYAPAVFQAAIRMAVDVSLRDDRHRRSLVVTASIGSQDPYRKRV